MWRSLACRHVRGASDLPVERPEWPISSSVSGSLNEVRVPKQWRMSCIVTAARFVGTFSTSFVMSVLLTINMQNTVTFVREPIRKVQVNYKEIRRESRPPTIVPVPLPPTLSLYARLEKIRKSITGLIFCHKSSYCRRIATNSSTSRFVSESFRN